MIMYCRKSWSTLAMCTYQESNESDEISLAIGRLRQSLRARETTCTDWPSRCTSNQSDTTQHLPVCAITCSWLRSRHVVDRDRSTGQIRSGPSRPRHQVMWPTPSCMHGVRTCNSTCTKLQVYTRKCIRSSFSCSFWQNRSPASSEIYSMLNRILSWTTA